VATQGKGGGGEEKDVLDTFLAWRRRRRRRVRVGRKTHFTKIFVGQSGASFVFAGH